MSKRENYLPKRQDITTIACHYEDDVMAQSHPALYQLMCQAKVEGRYRAGCRLTLFAEDGRLKASLWDPDTHMVWFCTMEGWESILDAVEAALTARRGEWREKRDNGSKR